MNTQFASIAAFSDTRLLAQVKHLVQHEREATANLVAHLAVLDERRLFLGEGCSSLFAYCTKILHLSEGAAYRRIQAARAARRFPVVLDKLADGRLNLTSLGLLAPHLTEANHVELLAAAEHKSKCEVEDLVAPLRPPADAKTSIRRLPVTRVDAIQPAVRLQEPAQAVLVPPPTAAASMRPHTPLRAPVPSATIVQQGMPAPARAPVPTYRIQFTASVETHAKLRRAQDLLRHQIPDGDPAAVIDRALSVLIAQLEKSKFGRVDRPRRKASRDAQPRGVPARSTGSGLPGDAATARSASDRAQRSRHIPAAVRRAVWQRDDGRCAFIGRDGRRCDDRGFLEFHHVEPFAAGGEASVENIELRCRAHNQHEADVYFAGGKASRPPIVRECAGVYEAGGGDAGVYGSVAHEARVDGAAECSSAVYDARVYSVRAVSVGCELGPDPVDRHVDFGSTG